MRLLLDTHVWIWSQEDTEHLGPQTKRLLLGPQHENNVCILNYSGVRSRDARK